jgi:HNH endonuclease
MEFEVEHLYPRALGGDDEVRNLALSCRSCNLRKLQATRAVDPVTGIAVLLFNPRRDVWLEHFTFIAETREIIGRTPTGRATVARLDLNRAQMIRARLLWSVTGWFPP